MARRKRHGRMSGLRKGIRKVGSAVGSILILGPAWEPAVEAFSDPAGLAGFGQNYVYRASGFDMGSGNLDTGYLTKTVIPRAAVFVGLGLFVKWLAKRA